MDHINKRVEYLQDKGTIKFYGKLLHKPKNQKVSTDGIWAGIVWDSKERGNHSGTVEGTRYFDCPNNIKNGSLVKAEKLNFGVTALEAFIKKYFKDEEAKQLLSDKTHLSSRLLTMIQFLKEKEINSDPSKIQTEYDEEAIIKTSINFKKIEFIGWDKVWKHMKNLKDVENLSLSNCNVSSLGRAGEIHALFPSVKQFSIENNLLISWEQVKNLSDEFPQLEVLWLCQNYLKRNDELEAETKIFFEEFADPLNLEIIQTELNETEKNKDVQNEPIPISISQKLYFGNLKSVFLLDMQLNWEKFSKVKSLFMMVEEMGLSQNNFNDFDKFDLVLSDFPNLCRLDLAENQISQSKDLRKIASLNIKKLNLSKNTLIDLEFGEFTPLITHLNVSDNLLSDIKIIAEVSRFPSLTNLFLLNNPALQFYEKTHVRSLLIAAIPKVRSINGSIVDRMEKRDCDIYYLKNTFHEYFKFSNTSALTYDLKAFYNWARPKYPLIDTLIQRMDNPYPIEDRYFEAPPNTINQEDANDKKKVTKLMQSNSNFAMFKFVKINEEGIEVALLVKKFPNSVDIGYLKTSLKNLLKLKTKITKMIIVSQTSGSIVLDNDMKKVVELVDASAEYKILLEF